MPRTISLELIDSVKVASPCTADWDSMKGDDRARFCDQCQLHVYNISAMSPEAAAALIREKEGHLCVRLFRRADGTVLTQDCPVGLRLIHRRLGRAFARIAGAAALLLGGAATLATGHRDSRAPRFASLQPFAAIRGWLSPHQPQVGRIEMGDCMAPIQVAPTSQVSR
jgi:hypothetical protein